DMYLIINEDGSIDIDEGDFSEYIEAGLLPAGAAITGYYNYLPSITEGSNGWSYGFDCEIFVPNATMSYSTTGKQLGSNTGDWENVTKRVHVENWETALVIHNFLGQAPVIVMMNGDGTCAIPLPQYVDDYDYSNDDFAYGCMRLVGCVVDGSSISRDYTKTALNGFVKEEGLEFFKLEYREAWTDTEGGEHEAGDYFIDDDPNYIRYFAVATAADNNQAAYGLGWCCNLSIQYDAMLPYDGDMMYVTEGITLLKGAAGVLPVAMRNAEDIVAFQFDIVLPSDLTVAQKNNADGELVNDISFTSRAKSTHIIGSNYQSDGSLRIVGYSSQNAAFRDYDGDLVNIAVEVSDDMEPGDYEITLKNVRITNADGKESVLPDMNFTLTITGVRGDANKDGVVTMGDVVAVLNYVLGNVPADFSFASADVTEDGNITMADVVGIVNLVLGVQNESCVTRRPSAGELLMQSALTMEAGRVVSVPLTLNATENYTAFQMDVKLPAGVTLEQLKLDNKVSNSHSLSFRESGNGMVRIVCWSPQNALLKYSGNNLLNMSLRANQSADEVSIQIDHVLFVKADGTEEQLSSLEQTGQITGIRSIGSDADSKPVYNLRGQRVPGSQKGIKIIDGKKIM
nr:dockerin type I repeat-containing protein [Prevotella sp.]